MYVSKLLIYDSPAIIEVIYTGMLKTAWTSPKTAIALGIMTSPCKYRLLLLVL